NANDTEQTRRRRSGNRQTVAHCIPAYLSRRAGIRGPSSNEELLPTNDATNQGRREQSSPILFLFEHLSVALGDPEPACWSWAARCRASFWRALFALRFESGRARPAAFPGGSLARSCGPPLASFAAPPAVRSLSAPEVGGEPGTWSAGLSQSTPSPGSAGAVDGD